MWRSRCTSILRLRKFENRLNMTVYSGSVLCLSPVCTPQDITYKRMGTLSRYTQKWFRPSIVVTHYNKPYRHNAEANRVHNTICLRDTISSNACTIVLPKLIEFLLCKEKIKWSSRGVVFNGYALFVCFFKKIPKIILQGHRCPLNPPALVWCHRTLYTGSLLVCTATPRHSSGSQCMYIIILC